MQTLQINGKRGRKKFEDFGRQLKRNKAFWAEGTLKINEKHE